MTPKISLVSVFFSSRRRHTRLVSDWSSDVCSSDLSSAPRVRGGPVQQRAEEVAQLVAEEDQVEDREGGPRARALLAQQHRERQRQHDDRSEERRVGKEGRARWTRDR